VNIQFHMLFEEALEFVREVSHRHGLEVELERWHPKARRAVPSGAELRDEVEQFGPVDQFWLLYPPPGARKPVEFTFQTARMRNNGLPQYQFGGLTSNAGAAEVLQEIARDLKACTAAGVWVTMATGRVHLNKKFRVSPGAAEAARAGKVRLVGL